MPAQFNAGGHRYLYDRGRYKRYGNQGSVSSTKSVAPAMPNQVANDRGGVDMSKGHRQNTARQAGMQPYQDFMFIKQKTVK